ncbi:MAG: fimbrillin family protein [Alistipes sp.]|nr:fimbrillin family protein [Alistipes sp.]
MKRYATYLAAALLMMGAASCSSASDDGAPKTVNVTFSTEILNRSAVNDIVTAFSNGDRLTLYSSTSSSVSSEQTVGGASYQEGVWNPTPAVTIAPKGKLYIMAIHPYDASATDPSAYPISVAAQKDYMYSGMGVSVSYEQPTATLRLRHAMAVVTLDIRSYVGGTLQSITVNDSNFPTAGTLRITGAVTTTEKGSYTKTMNVPLSSQGFTNDHPGMFVIPYKTADTGFEVVVKISGKDYTVKLPSANFTAAKKYVARLAHTEHGVVLEKSDWEIISFEEQSETVESSYSMLAVKVQGSSFVAPLIMGSNLNGVIYWGDGQQNVYAAGADHTYTTANTYTVKFDLWNANAVTFNSLKGVEEIDLSKF